MFYIIVLLETFKKASYFWNYSLCIKLAWVWQVFKLWLNMEIHVGGKKNNSKSKRSQIRQKMRGEFTIYKPSLTKQLFTSVLVTDSGNLWRFVFMCESQPRCFLFTESFARKVLWRVVTGLFVPFAICIEAYTYHNYK